MLVCISDLHLTDGSTGKYNVNAATFRNFWNKVLETSRVLNVEEIELAILGDFFDLLHSTKWLEGKARPWSEKGEEQFKIIELILNDIFRENKELLAYLTNISKTTDLRVKVSFILGDHDWFINRYDSLREKVCNQLRLAQNPAEKFSSYIRREEYRVFARHGHEYDMYHFEGDYEAPSINDAIVIELINRFPTVLMKTFGEKIDKSLLQKLREIEDVRPLLDVPGWVLAVAEESTNQETTEAIKKCWDDLVDQFNNLAYMQEWYKLHSSWAPPDEADRLKERLKITPLSPVAPGPKPITLSRIMMSRFIRGEDRHPREAYNEDYIRQGPIQYIVLGHTHQSRILSLDRTNSIEKIYFNVGTWRSVHTQNKFGSEKVLFTSWRTLNYAIFYKEGEHPYQSFEFWSAALK